MSEITLSALVPLTFACNMPSCCLLPSPAASCRLLLPPVASCCLLQPAAASFRLLLPACYSCCLLLLLLHFLLILLPPVAPPTAPPAKQFRLPNNARCHKLQLLRPKCNKGRCPAALPTRAYSIPIHLASIGNGCRRPICVAIFQLNINLRQLRINCRRSLAPQMLHNERVSYS